MARHRASGGHRVRPPDTAPARPVTSHRSHRAGARQSPVQTRVAVAPGPHRRARPAPAELPDRPAVNLTPDKPWAAPAELSAVSGAEPTAATAPEAETSSALPRVMVETLVWVGFAAIVALGVIAASGRNLGAAALWAAGLGGIVVVAMVLLTLTGTRLDTLARPRRAEPSPE